MHSAEARLMQIARHVGMSGIRAAKAFNEAQAQLQLFDILSQARLASPEGVTESLATLERLARRTRSTEERWHK